MSAEDLFSPGQVLNDRYRVIRIVGKGGTGEVYEVHDTERGQRMALKTVLRDHLGNEKVMRRFERELEFSQRISHPNVLPIFELFKTALESPEGAADGTVMVPCMVMEFLEGETLADRLIRGEILSPEAARPLVDQIVAALAAAHDAGIVHRDLKPDNMFLVREEDGGTRVVLTDFGVARQTEPLPKDESLTASNVLLGTPTYMAPEQLELEDAMPASDIYTLGLVMFEMLTGRQPFEAETPIKMVFKRVQEDPPSPRIHLPDLDLRWEKAILRCLERRPEDRFHSVRGVISVLDGADSGRLDAAKARERKELLSRTLAAAAAITAIAAAFFLLLFLL